MDTSPKTRFFKLIQDFRFIAVIFILCVIVVSIQKMVHPGYNNNFTIFRMSFYHLMQHLNMYVPYPQEHNDVFLYNPSFPVLFAPFAIPPIQLGIILWISISAFLFFVTVRLLPIKDSSKVFIYYFSIIELVTALERCQTNPIIAILIMLAFIAVEREQLFRATLYTNLGFFIKGYGAVSGIFYFLKNPKFKTFLMLGFWFIVIFALPLIFYSPKEIITLYQQWYASLSEKFNKNTQLDSHIGGVSLMCILINLFRTPASQIPDAIKYIEFSGYFIIIFTTAYLAWRKNYEQVKWYMLAYVLIWVIIFNHASESSTYIVAIPGVAIWYLASPRGYLEKSLLIITFILSVLSPTDIFDLLIPKFKQEVIQQYALKALGPSLIWFYIQISLFLPQKKVRNEARI
jgi:hypothetical protein